MTYIKKIKAAVLKAIQSTKQGENGFKKLADGSYFNAYDTIPECYKFIEDVITFSDINQDVKRLTYGLAFDSE